MDDFFSIRSPFEANELKRKEFKDAIMSQALKKYQETIEEEIHVISNDDGFLKSFEGNPNFITYKQNKKFLQFVNSQLDEVCSAFEEFHENYADWESIMGHSDIAVTLNVYTHLGLDDARA